MKVKRVKGAKKIINFYKNSFGIFEPYQVLIDLTFCQAAILGKVLLKEQIPKYFDAKVQLVTTNCIIEEGKALGPSLNGAVSIAKKFQVRLCGHKKSPVPAAECIKSIIGPSNTNRYFVATQDRELQTHLESIPGVPLMYLNHNCMVLEKPTPLSYDTAQQIQDSKVNPTSLEKETIAKLKGEPESEEKRRRKRKKPSGPNPLSILKKKRTADKTMSQTVKKKRIRKRKKAKVPTHVLQALTKES
ncbi:rRNA-processing protein UTP23 homolog isoform X1 [Actinia tenebrosa]|uniref:rRNA-processing protein UTP23 homolog n=1 Tax=Actinia tenebrosa TaxID=6105 RepID=A0A6P8III2_ACTTE|nr:rRNA-processing protein UTP23 homolog isoform X1 [Actinia tenebrosa]